MGVDDKGAPISYLVLADGTPVYSSDGQRLGDVQVGRVLLDLLAIMRRHRVRVNASFTIVNIAIAVTEGIGKQLDPELDLMVEALPYFLSHPVETEARGA